MSALSDYAENKIVDHVLGTAAWTMPTGIYVALHTAAPEEDASPTNEVGAGWYARKQAATGWNAADTVTPANGATNNGAVTWDAVTGASVTVTHVSLWDAVSGGQMLWYKALAASKLFGVGSVPTIPDVGLNVTAGGAFSNYLIPKIIDHLLRTTPFSSPASVYLAMADADLTAANLTVNEISGGSYARQLITFDTGVGGAAGNALEEDFGTASANLGTISHWGLYNAATVGDLLIFGAWNTPSAVDNGDIYKVLDDTLTINAL